MGWGKDSPPLGAAQVLHLQGVAQSQHAELHALRREKAHLADAVDRLVAEETR